MSKPKAEPAHKSIYVMRTEILGGGLTKVGVSGCVDRRHRALRDPRRLKDLRIVRTWQRPGDAYQIECQCHHALRPYRVGKEWFSCSAEHACQVVERIILEADDAAKFKVSDNAIYRYFPSAELEKIRTEK
jgi:hypothetical protein